jgi:hypothetical protein
MAGHRFLSRLTRSALPKSVSSCLGAAENTGVCKLALLTSCGTSRCFSMTAASTTMDIHHRTRAGRSYAARHGQILPNSVIRIGTPGRLNDGTRNRPPPMSAGNATLESVSRIRPSFIWSCMDVECTAPVLTDSVPCTYGIRRSESASGGIQGAELIPAIGGRQLLPLTTLQTYELTNLRTYELWDYGLRKSRRRSFAARGRLGSRGEAGR